MKPCAICGDIVAEEELRPRMIHRLDGSLEPTGEEYCGRCAEDMARAAERIERVGTSFGKPEG